ncbi:sodium:proton antiporter [Chromatiales bacterium (ex Bugula neritina AB1)]|nr:sodium:proton antiporter [Chromatiales bacterium (ex Bugula neritina AB1)]
MNEESILYTIFLIFTGASIVATAALFARQSLLVAYIVVGLLAGPHISGLISDPALITDIANVGIIFLLFLLGLNLEPDDLRNLLREATVVTLISSSAFAFCGFSIALFFGFTATDSVVIGATLMFSSTIVGLKLLPTSALHHQRMGEIIVSILLLQDMIAVIVLLLLQGIGSDGSPLFEVIRALLLLPLISTAAYFASRHLLSRLFIRFDQISEYIFLLTLGWCLGIAELAHAIGLSHEIGAFIAGVTLAANPIARFIAESLKPLRDFFLIMFFFGLGAGFDVSRVTQVIVPATVLAIAAILLKPLVFRLLLRREKEKKSIAGEIGVRLGQISEFSLLVAVVATSTGIITARASMTIQTATILTFVLSSYWIVMRYPTPIANDEKLRRD